MRRVMGIDKADADRMTARIEGRHPGWIVGYGVCHGYGYEGRELKPWWALTDRLASRTFFVRLEADSAAELERWMAYYEDRLARRQGFDIFANFPVSGYLLRPDERPAETTLVA